MCLNTRGYSASGEDLHVHQLQYTLQDPAGLFLLISRIFVVPVLHSRSSFVFL